MGQAHEEAVIERPAAEIWQIVGAFDDLRWYPGVDRCTVVGDLRTTSTGGSGIEIDQREFARDDANRTYTYGPIAVRGATPSESSDPLDLCNLPGHYRVTLSVIPEGDDACRLRLALDFEGEPDAVVERTLRSYAVVLSQVKANLDG